jgi:hypothetical protein
MNEENNFFATVKRITRSLNRRLLIASAAIGIILLVTSVVVYVLQMQMQAERDFLANRKAIMAYIQTKKNISSYSEQPDYTRP